MDNKGQTRESLFRPKIIDTLRHYSGHQFLKDSVAGLVVGIIAIPLAIAFAVASGVTPEHGLITAIIAGFLISLLGGSRVQIGGPTGAFIVIVYGIVQTYGFNGLVLSTFIAGILLIAFGLLRLGSVIRFIPHSLIVGFTAGISFVIFTSQINDFLGLGLQGLPVDFIDKMTLIINHIGQIQPYAVIVGLGTILIIGFGARVFPGWPGSLFAIILFSLLISLFGWPVETIGSRFGDMRGGIPLPSLPEWNFKMIQNLLHPSISIALLAAIESLLSAVVADGMIGGKHRSNTELIGQGVANLVSPLFGGIPATGAIARTATNIRSGGRTPVAGLIHALVILLVLLFFGRWVAYIPLPCLSGILIVVAFNMAEWEKVRALMRTSGSSTIVIIGTFLMTVLVDLTVAIEMGLLISAFLFIRKMVLSTRITLFQKTDTLTDDETDLEERRSFGRIPAGVVVFGIDGPLFFGAAYKFREALSGLRDVPSVMLIRMNTVPVIDSSGLHLLQEGIFELQNRGAEVIVTGLRPLVAKMIHRSGLHEKIDRKNFLPSYQKGILRAKQIVEEKRKGKRKGNQRVL